jgi:hypothetical protein
LNGANTTIKQVGLFGGIYHDLKTTIREATQELASLRSPFKSVIEGNRQLVSTAHHDAWVQKNLENGWC